VKRARFERLRRSRTLYPGVADALGPAFPWHSRADGPRSSQGLCLSVWVPLAGLEARHALVESIVQAALGASSPIPPRDDRRWRISVEVSRPQLLGEDRGGASAIDVVLEADDAVLCVESKYLSDAAAGLDGCGQFPLACRGFHGPGSDLGTGTAAPCRLGGEAGGERRRYWEVAARLFRPEALEYGGEPATCPLLPHYQLARTLFFAAEAARYLPEESSDHPAAESGDHIPAESAAHFAAVVLAPRATAARLERQVAAFRRDVLRPELADHVALALYDDLARLLRSSGDPAAADVGRFLAARLPESPARPPRTQTVREMKAEAARRRHCRQR